MARALHRNRQWQQRAAPHADGWRGIPSRRRRLSSGQKLAGVVVDVKCRCSVWEGEPTDFRSRVDVDVWRDAPRVNLGCRRARTTHLADCIR
jgi:hypothetical protein